MLFYPKVIFENFVVIFVNAQAFFLILVLKVTPHSFDTGLMADWSPI